MIRVRMGPVQTGGLGNELLAETRKRGPAAVRAGRRVVVREMKRLLQLRSGGPAPRGAPPARVEGDLARSIRQPAVEVKRYLFAAPIHVDHPGANRLEFGARDSRGIETHPHPFAGPAFANKAEEAERAMRDAL